MAMQSGLADVVKILPGQLTHRVLKSLPTALFRFWAGCVFER